MWYVYILLCEDNSLYTGASNDVQRRFSEHVNGTGGHYTRSHKPLRVVYMEQHPTQSDAFKREAQIKGWSRKKKIEILNLSDLI